MECGANLCSAAFPDPFRPQLRCSYTTNRSTRTMQQNRPSGSFIITTVLHHAKNQHLTENLCAGLSTMIYPKPTIGRFRPPGYTCCVHHASTILLLCCVLVFGCSTAGARRCELHKIAMCKEAVPVRYGRAPLTNSERAAQASNPHVPVALGGCVVSPGSPQYRLQWVCPTCASNYGAAAAQP